MPRRAIIQRRDVNPDPKYGSRLVAKFINVMMRGGKRSLSEGIMYSALDIMGDRAKQDPLKLFKQAVENVKPALEVKSRRVGGSTYQVPVEVRPERRTSLSMRWLVGFARSRPEKTMQERLAAELLDAANNPVQLIHDPSHSIETVVDALGKPTTYEYDDRGNWVKKVVEQRRGADQEFTISTVERRTLVYYDDR